MIIWAAVLAAGLFLMARPIALAFDSPVLAPALAVASLDILPYALFQGGAAFLAGSGRFARVAGASVLYGTGKFLCMGAILLMTGDIVWVFAGMATASAVTAFSVWRSVPRSRRVLNDEDTGQTSAPGRGAPDHGVRHSPDVATPRAGSLPRVLEMRDGGHADVLPVLQVPADKADAVPCEGLRRDRLFSLLLVGGTAVLLHEDLWLVQLLAPGESSVGQYGAAYNLSKVLYIGALSVAVTMLPSFARRMGIALAFQQDPRLFLPAGLLVSGLSLGAAGLMLLPRAAIELLFGPGFQGTGAYLVVLAPSYAFLALGLVWLQALFQAGSVRIASLMAVAGGLVFPACAWPLAHIYGPQGIACALGITGLLLVMGGALTSFVKRGAGR